jgi:hypothetical protein
MASWKNINKTSLIEDFPLPRVIRRGYLRVVFSIEKKTNKNYSSHRDCRRRWLEAVCFTFAEPVIGTFGGTVAAKSRFSMIKHGELYVKKGCKPCNLVRCGHLVILGFYVQLKVFGYTP